MNQGVEYTKPRNVGGPESLISLERRKIAESYGATPFEKTRRQLRIRKNLLGRIIDNRPNNLPEHIFDYIKNHFEIRFAKRQQRNTDSYLQRLNKNDAELSDDEHRLVKFAHDGFAYPGELLDVRKILGMASVELGRVTHPYGNNLDDLVELRQKTNDAVAGRGGEVYDIHEFETFEVEDTDRSITQEPTLRSALLVVRTRVIGMLPDGTEIHERSSFILNLAKAVDDETLAAMQMALFYKGKSIHEQLQKAVDIKAIAQPLVDNDDWDAAIPLSTTIFAFNPATRKAIETSLNEQVQREYIEAYQAPAQWFVDAIKSAQRHEVVDTEH